MGKRSAGAEAAGPSGPPAKTFVGANLGLPPKGPGSVAPWLTRITSLVLDWALSMIIAVLIFSPTVLTASGWRSFMILAVFLVQTATVSALTGGSVGQLLTRLSVARLDRRPLGFVRAFARALMLCLVIPALVIDENRRGLHDLVCGTAVLTKR